MAPFFSGRRSYGIAAVDGPGGVVLLHDPESLRSCLRSARFRIYCIHTWLRLPGIVFDMLAAHIPEGHSLCRDV